MLTVNKHTNTTSLNWRKMDKAWTALIAILIVIAAADTSQLRPSVTFTYKAFVHTLPYLFLAVMAAAYAKASGAENIIAKVFSGNVIIMIVLAALVGGLSPFCSCGVIPLIASLLSMGVPLPAVMAFWLSSPIMDPSMFFLTVGTLGLPFAIAKTATAVGLGLFGGYSLLALQKLSVFSSPLRTEIKGGGCTGGSSCSRPSVVWSIWRAQERRSAFKQETQRAFLFLSKWMLLAFLLESVMLAYIPSDMITNFINGNGIGSITVAALVGVPAYLNGYAALPLAAGFIEQGMSQGVAMSFLVAGGVSSLPAAIAVFALVRPPVFVMYITFALIGAVSAGLITEAIL